jgi:ferric-dicitrate binding protein FerR (iron transport regulator)
MDTNRIWVLIGKKIAGNATPVELTELDSLMAEHVSSDYPLRELEEIWLFDKNLPNEKTPDEIQVKWEKFKTKLPADNRILSLKQFKKNKPVIWLAACLIAALFILIIKLSIDTFYNPDNLFTSVVKAPAGSTGKIVLPDGTKVWLNANSKITYKKHFGERYREVYLAGEAFFDVVKDAKHPFIVNTSSLRLRVLGTAFNVRSFKTDKTSEAALVRGSIEVTLVDHPDKKLTLKPSEKIVVRNPDATTIKSLLGINNTNSSQTPLITLSNIHYSASESLPQEAQWIEKKLAFTSESFDDIAGRMERYYNVKIDFQDEDAKNIIFSGSFKDESIEQAMKALQASGNFHYKIADNTITINK